MYYTMRRTTPYVNRPLGFPTYVLSAVPLAGVLVYPLAHASLCCCCCCAFHSGHVLLLNQACKVKFSLRELTSSSCSAAAKAVCFKGRVAGLDAIETGHELSQPIFELTSLFVTERGKGTEWSVVKKSSEETQHYRVYCLVFSRGGA